MAKTQKTIAQFVRYLMVGGFAAVVDTGTLYFLNASLGVNHLVAAAIGFLLGLIVNYAISIAWIFETTGQFKEEFALFALIGVGGLAWTELILWITINFARFPLLPSKMAALFLVLIWNFGMRKRFVFSQGVRSESV